MLLNCLFGALKSWSGDESQTGKSINCIAFKLFWLFSAQFSHLLKALRCTGCVWELFWYGSLETQSSLSFSARKYTHTAKASPWLPQLNDNIVSDLKSSRWLNKLYCRYGNTGMICHLPCVCVRRTGSGQTRKRLSVFVCLHLIMSCTVYCSVCVFCAELFPCVYDP